MKDEKVPRKLRNRETIMIDPQILRWREKMRKLQAEGKFLGKHSKKQRDIVEKEKQRKKDVKEIKAGTKRFF